MKHKDAALKKNQISHLCFGPFISWSQLLETLPLPNVRIFFSCAVLAHMHEYLKLKYEKFYYLFHVSDKVDMPNSSYPTDKFIWGLSFYCL